MGLDLTLCPDRYDTLGGRSMMGFLAHTRIDLDRNYELFGRIVQGMGRDDSIKGVCKPKPLSVEFQWYGDEGLETRKTDPYGTPLTYVTAGELAKVDVPEDTSDWNKAVFALVKKMDPDTAIVLWWH